MSGTTGPASTTALNRAVRLAGLAWLLAGCTAGWQAPLETRQAAPAVLDIDAGDYRVRPGDTLYGLAWNAGADWRTLARWNGITAPYTIYPGQVLRFRPPPGGAARVNLAAATPPPSPSRDAPSPAASSPAASPATARAAAKPAAGAAPGPAVQAQPKPPPTDGASVQPAASPAPKPPPAPAPAPAAPPKLAAAKPAAPPEPAPKPSVPLPSGPLRWQWPTDGQVVSAFRAKDPDRKGVKIAGTVGQAVRATERGKVVYSGDGLIGYGRLVIIKHNDRYLSAYGLNQRLRVKEGDQVVRGTPIAEMGRSNAGTPQLHFEIRKDGIPINPLLLLPKKG